MAKKIVTSSGKEVQGYEAWKASGKPAAQKPEKPKQIVTASGKPVQSYEAWRSQKNEALRPVMEPMYQQLKKVGMQQETARDFYSQWRDTEARKKYGQVWREDAQELKTTLEKLEKDLTGDSAAQEELRNLHTMLDAHIQELEENDRYWNQWSSQAEYGDYQRRKDLWMNQGNHLEAARGQLEVKPASDGLADEEREKQLRALDSKINLTQKQLSSMGRGLDTASRNAAIQDTQAKLTELMRERQAIALGGEHSQRDALEQEIQNTKKQLSQIMATFETVESRGLALASPEAKARYKQANRDYIDTRKRLAELEQEKARLDRVEKYDGKTYKDTFWGQSKANYSLGRLSQDSSLAWNKYLNNPTEENRRNAETIDQLMTQFQQENEETLADDGKLPWLSKTLANYIPQFLDQAGYSIAGGSLGLMTGNPYAVKAGITAGSGAYSYETMRGAAFKALLEAGMDEATARKAANDEALISSLIEMGDTALDLFTLGGGKAIDLLTKGSLTGLEKQLAKFAGKNTLTRLGIAAGKYGLNLLSEGLEESSQEAVSIANTGREESGLGDLALEALKTLWGAATNGEDPNREQIFEAGKEGMKLAAMLGVTGQINNSISTVLEEKGYRETLAPHLDELMEQARELDSENQLVKDIQGKIDKGKRVSGWTLEELARQTVEKRQELTSQAIQENVYQRLEELGETGDLNVLAQALTKEATGERLTKAERKALEESKFSKEVAKEITPEAVEQWTKDLPKLKIFQAQKKAPEQNHKLITAVLQELNIPKEDGATMMASFHPWEGYTESDYATAIRKAYQYGEKELPLEQMEMDAYIEPNVLQMAYNDGKMKAAVNRAKLQQEAKANEAGEEVYLRQGAQWADGENPGGEVSPVGQGTEGNPGGEAEAQGQPGSGGADSGDAEGRVSTRELGITGGTESRHIRRYSGKETKDIQKARAVAEKHGLEVEFFAGGNLEVEDGSGRFEARAMVQGEKMFVRTDHPDFSAEQLAKHEAGHVQVGRGEIDPGTVYDRMVKMYGGEEMVLRVIQDYVEAYNGTLDALTNEEVFEELICDSVADMNIFKVDPDGMRQGFLGNLKYTTEENIRENTTRGPPLGSSEQMPKYSKDESYESQVEKVISGTFDRSNAVFVCMTPTILEEIGLNGDIPMLTTAQHIRKALMPKNDKLHQHGLTEEQVKRLPQQISEPVILMDSRDRSKNTVIAVTEMVDPDGEPIIATIHADGRGMYNNIEVASNFVTSYYGRNNFSKFLARNIEEGNILYINRKKATALSAESSTQWLEQLRDYDFDTIIRQSRVNVKKFSRETPAGNITESQETEEKLGRIQREEPELYRDVMSLNAMAPDMPRGKINWETLEQIEEDPIEWQRYDARRKAVQTKYGDGKVRDMLDLLRRRKRAAEDMGRSGAELYFDTAGEIEARDVSHRRRKTAEQRKSSPPYLGNEDTVFEREQGTADDYIPGDVSDREIETGIHEVAEMSPISEISGAEFTTEGRTLLDDVDRFFKSAGGQVYHPRLGDINLTRRGVKDSIAHGMTAQKASAFAAIPDVLREGKVVAFDKNWKGRGYDSATIAAPITIGGEEYMMAVIVHRSNSANRFYVHDVFAEKEEVTPFMTGAQSVGLPGGVTSTISIIRKILSVKRENTKTVGENIRIFEGKKSDIRYSRETPDAAKLERENRKLRQQLEYWKGKPKFRNNDKARPEDVRKVVNKIIKNWQSQVDKADLTREMQALADTIIRYGDELSEKGKATDGPSYEDVMGKAADLAWEIVDNSQTLVNGEDMEIFQEIKAYLRSTPIRLREKNDIPDFQEFKKKYRGKIRLNEGGTAMDSMWIEMQDRFGVGFFPEDITHPADQLLHIGSLLDNMDPHYENLYRNNMNSAVQSCANEIVGELFSDAVKPVMTYQDKELSKLEREAKEKEDMLSRIRAEKKSLEAQNAEIRRGIDQTAASWELYRNARSKTEVKNQIVRLTDQIDKILNRGTKERNVKEGLQEAAGAVLRLSNVLFSDMRMGTILENMPQSERVTLTKDEEEARGKYLDLAVQKEKLKQKKRQLERLAKESSEAWESTQQERQELEQEIREKQEGMIYLAEKLQAVVERQKKRLKNQGMVGQAIEEMASTYKKLEKTTESHLAWAYDELVYNRMLELKEDLENTFVDDLSKGQLEQVRDILHMMMTTIRNANELFAAEKGATAQEQARLVQKELEAKAKEGKDQSEIAKITSRFAWNNLKPIFAFLRIDSEHLTKLYQNVRNGEDTYARNRVEAESFLVAVKKKYHFDSWDMDKKFSFRATSGKSFELTAGEIMTMYAYSKRKQSWDHLIKGGFVFDADIARRVKGKLKKFYRDDATAYNVAPEIWGDITSKLTKEQMGFVDEMQDYLSNVMGAKGNEVSRKLYGIPLFQEEHYLPLRTSDVYLARVKAQQEGTAKIKNSGFTKSTEDHAKTAVVLTPFMELWADHVEDMNNYHSFVLPLEDFYRVYNFSTVGDGTVETNGTIGFIQKAHGSAAKEYIDQLLKDINAGKVIDPTEGVAKSLISKFKKASVMASASVLLRQFSAGPRAMAIIDPKYFVGRKMTRAGHKKRWEELKTYAPIASIKEWGYFDTHMGKSAREAMLSAGKKSLDDILSIGASWADETTWIGIWEAAKRETQDKHKDLKVGSEEFLQAAGERFTEVITMTQVYDSVFARSANMRSGSAIMGAITSFMAEPTTNLNLAGYAARQFLKGDKGDKKQAVMILSAVSASIVLDSMLGALVYASRDDDEEKNFVEKYVENMVGGLMDGFNILNYLPLVRDIMSISQGYDIERADMTLINGLLDGINSWGKLALTDTSEMNSKQLKEHEQKKRDAMLQVANGIASLLGFPLRNILRDGAAVMNLFNDGNYKKSSKGSIWNAAIEGGVSAMPFSRLFPTKNRSDKLYGAILSGDDTYRERLESLYTDDEGNPDHNAVENAIIRGMRDNDPRVRRGAEAWNQGDFETYLDAAEAMIANGFPPDEVYRAIQTEAKALLPEEEEEAPKEKAYGAFTADAYVAAILSGNPIVQTIREEILAIDQENGKTLEEAERSLESAVKSRLKEAYLSPETGVADWDAEKLLAEYGGMRQDEAEQTVRGWNFEESHGMTYSEMLGEYESGNISRSEMESAMGEYGLKNYEIAEKLRSMDEAAAFEAEFGMSYTETRDAYKHQEISRETMLQALQASGKTELEAEDTLREWDIENRLGIAYSKLDDAYKYGDISREELYNAMIENGEVPAKAEEAVQCYDWLKERVEEYPELAISDARHFVVQVSSDCKDYTLGDFGVDVDTYLQYKQGAKDCDGEDADGDGRADSYTKAKELFAMIDSLPIPDLQKEGLAYISNPKSTVRKYAPWR